jgi:hypothetical protein
MSPGQQRIFLRAAGAGCTLGALSHSLTTGDG